MIVKACGITRVEDAAVAVEAGATAIGFVFWRDSPRWIEPARAAAIAADVPPSVARVGVFVDAAPAEMLDVAAQVGLTIVQLHGHESPACVDAVHGLPVWRAVTLDTAEDVLRTWPSGTIRLLDAHDPRRRGGTGQRIDWVRAREVAATARVILAGGLSPENVGDAVRTVRPLGVDVSSGVEQAPGIKDAARLRLFIARARAALGDLAAG